ncbi:HEAT repeat domain-containing protein [Massilia sp. MB5]|uniref:HEAT repeat domain-containing protein n=1 Tax=unclassified Massilia TaxID=2609279 RepID=UPI00067B04DB|nr:MULTISPECIES: HEAT repeat domain-containing protein [unclassified Massilia]UMR28931.1 HEAT repeat domain-containing protein [Massilia sp. MB5]
MDSRLHSDIYLLAAFWTGVGALLLTLLIAVQIVYLRLAARSLKRREQALTARWRPALNAAIVGVSEMTLPGLRSAERILFLKLWVHLHQSVRGEASGGLNEVAYRLGCDAYARRLLHKGNRAQRLLAILALGHLRDAAAWDDLLGVVHGSDSAASVHALWALVQADAARAAREVAPMLLQREDWAMSQLANILKDARAEWEPVLAEAVAGTDQEQLPHALRLLAALRLSLPAQQLRGLLNHPVAEVVSCALRLAATPDLLDEVRRQLGHGDWRVRVQAVRTLGQLGDHSDVERLRRLLGDQQWWVRYRAAQALLGLPFLTPDDLAALQQEDMDRYALDMLKQVRAEQEAA